MMKLQELAGILMLGGALPGGAARAEEMRTLGVREVTVFKDGHALVLREGRMGVDSAGDVVLDDLPAPVLGTFWPYVEDGKVRLRAVTAGARKIEVERTALSLEEMIQANIGADAVIRDVHGEEYRGRIASIPVRSADELKRTSPPGTAERLAEKGTVLLLEMEHQTQVIALASIRDLAFKGDMKPAYRAEEMRNVLTLDLDWGQQAPGASAEVGLMYVQRGLRWIPNYKVVVDGEGRARIDLQATIINELADLEDVSMNLVVGVPTFAFKDTPDPLAFQATIAQLGMYFQPNAQTGQSFSNAIMTQARFTESQTADYSGGGHSGTSADQNPDDAGTDRAEDVFVFHVEHFTLRKGSRAVVPVKSFELDYESVFTLKLPITPPAEVRQNFDWRQRDEVARMLSQVKVQHVLRLKNTSDCPLTTAPALIFSGEQLLAQGMMTYTAVGGTSDLSVTAAVDIRHSKEEKETGRIPEAAKWHGSSFARVDFEGVICIENFKNMPVKVEVVRSVLGNATEAGADGAIKMINSFEEGDEHFGTTSRPVWWYWYSWPYGWNRYNSMGRITWNVTIEPGKKVELPYKWNYYWQ